MTATAMMNRRHRQRANLRLAHPDASPFKLPQKLRGWFTLDRAHLPYREHTSILTSTTSTLYSKIRTVLRDSYQKPQLRTIDRALQNSPGKNGSQRAMYGEDDYGYNYGYLGEDGTGFEYGNTSEWVRFESTGDHDDVDPDACAHVDEDGD